MIAQKIIALSGLAGSGKDSAADLLVNGHGFVKMALADPIKKLVQQVYQFTDFQLWGPSEERNKPDPRFPRSWHTWSGRENLSNRRCEACGARWEEADRVCHLTPRYALQRLGSEWGRNNYENTWCDLLLRTIVASGAKRVVIPDCRFSNEFEILKAFGAQLVRIKRSGLKTTFQHDSETQQLKWGDERFDAVLHNDGSLESLSPKVTGLLQELR